MEQPSDHVVEYDYDAAYQLTREERTGSNAYAIDYTYDATGNRLTKVQNGVTENYTYGDNNQLLTAGTKTYAYDNNGNPTSVTVGTDVTTLAWDYNDKLTGITYPNSSTNSFVTNDQGHRISKTDSAGTSSYLYDGSRVLADSRADYTNGGVSGLISERAGSTSKVYHGDHLGSTRGLTDGSEVVTDSREYDAWGINIASSGSGTPFGFAGGHGYEKDPDSGLMLLGARYFDSSIGRFISRDPIGYNGGWNVYGYCYNDPVNLVDPDGRKPGDPYKDLLEAAKAAAAELHAKMMASMLKDRIEYGAKLYLNGDGKYSYTDFSDGGKGSVNIGRLILPDGVREVGRIHTHPTTPYWTYDDIRNATALGRDSFMVNSFGNIVHWSPNQKPDPNDPKWLNLPIDNRTSAWSHWIGDVPKPKP